jgi:hypothetical protein
MKHNPLANVSALAAFNSQRNGEISGTSANSDLAFDQRLAGSHSVEYLDGIEISSGSTGLVANLIDECSNVLLFGESNTGKSFFGLFLGMSVATGSSFFGREVRQGGVMYCATEGGRRIADRVIALREAMSLQGVSVPFALVRGQIDLRASNADIEFLSKESKVLETRFGVSIKLIVIDTLSRVLAGGDENDSAAMGHLVKSIDRLRLKTGAAVLLVHHSGKTKDKGARGHSLLKCAVDTEIEIETSKNLGDRKKVKIRKQRDFDISQPLIFRLKPITLSVPDGGTRTTCVVEPILETAFDFIEERQITPTARECFEVLMGLVKGLTRPVIAEKTWREALKKSVFQGVDRRRVSEKLKDAVSILSASGHIENDRGYVHVLKDKIE